MPRARSTTLLGTAVLGTAVALLAAACLADAPRTGHPAAHPAAAPASAPPAAPPSAPAPAPGSSSLPASAHPVPPPTVSSRCTATVELAETWPGGYRAEATIENRGDKPMSGWYIQWTFPLGTTITQAWKGTPMVSGPVGMIHAPEQDPVLAPGAAVTGIGFVGAASEPPAFTEVSCG
ncbi:cellulose binding domain-containing protein [Planomonospora corallina]|uniref:Cellulose binding domain-containing protein n=1 Tax=Planomonospora corallina TaxID=1806052 RepID=A0ABV8IBR5_9ACTN